MDTPFSLDPKILCQGLSWAQGWASGPVLCVLSPDAISLAIASEGRFIAAWEWRGELEAARRFFLIPPFVASMLTSPQAYQIRELTISTRGASVQLFLRDQADSYTIAWRWRAESFQAPPFFEQMLESPKDTVERQTFIAIADAVHLAIANLGRLEGLEQMDRENLAIMVDFSPGHFKIDGQPITLGYEKRYYFDPRLIVRGLEIARGKHIGFSVRETTIPGQSILYMSSDRNGWRVTCAMLSLLPDATTTILSHNVKELNKSDSQA